MLFIGGSKDGKRIEIDNFRTEIYFPVLPKEEIYPWEERDKVPDRCYYKVEKYKLNTLSGNSLIFEIMALENFTGDSIIESLIENYNPK